MKDAEHIISNRIDPQPRTPDEPDAFETAWEAFDAGNYPKAFIGSKGKNPELCALATIMCGAIRPGLERLNGIDHLSEEAKIIKAYAEWCLGEGQGLMDHFSEDLRRPIDVLVFTMPNSSHIIAFEETHGFNVHSVQLTPDQFGISLKDILSKLPKGFTPKLGLGIDCYGPYLPTGLYESSIPIAFWAMDYDFFFPTRHGDLSHADVIVVNAASEHSALAQCFDVRIAAFPCHDNYDQSEVSIYPPDAQFIDILFTGRAYTPYMRDRAQQLFRLACIDDPEIQIKIYDGYFNKDDFISIVRSARSVPLFCRFGGGFQTRAIDVLRQGVSVFSSESGICRGLLDSGSAYYQLVGTDSAELATMNKLKHLSAKPKSVDKAFHEDFKNLFWPSPKREERFLKFCLLQTLIQKKGRQIPSDTTAIPVELRGYDVEPGVAVYTSIMKRNMSFPVSPAHFNYAGAAGFYSSILAQNNQKLARQCLGLFREGISRYPLNATLAFNYARVLWTFGKLEEACTQFEHLISKRTYLTFEPRTDSLLSHRVQVLSKMFPYSDFYRSVVASAINPSDVDRPLNMIIAGAKTYLAKAALSQGDADRALAFLMEATDICRVNFAAYRLQVLTLNTIRKRPADLLSAFYAGVNLYPPLLFELLSYGIDVELSQGQEGNARDILRKFILVYSRSSKPDGTPLDIPDETKLAVRRHLDLLSDWASDVAYRMIDSGRL